MGISSKLFAQTEEFQLGQFLHQRYLDESSPNFIQGINNTIADENQFRARADAGGEAGVIYNSALALLQGLFPPTLKFSETLGNGTNVTAPFNGYQVDEHSIDSTMISMTDTYCIGNLRDTPD